MDTEQTQYGYRTDTGRNQGTEPKNGTKERNQGMEPRNGTRDAVKKPTRRCVSTSSEMEERPRVMRRAFREL